MLDKASCLPDLLRRIEALPAGHCLDLRTYKRNRSVLFRRLGPDRWLVVRRGFGDERFECGPDKLKKQLRRLLKAEFPRSTKIRVYALGPCDADAPEPRKTL